MLNYVKPLLINTTLFGLFLLFSSKWANYSQISMGILKVEFIIFLTFSVLLVPTALKSDKKYYLGAIAFIILYLILDGVFLILNRLPSFSDFNEIMPLLNFMPIYIISGLIIGSLYLSFCAWLFAYNDSIKTTIFKFVGMMPLGFVLFFTINSGYSKKVLPKDHGRISSILINEKFSKDLVGKLSDYENVVNINDQYQDNKIISQKNIHIIILESYTDPRLYNISKNLKEKITKLIPKIDFDLYISPTFAGGTSKTEFEILSGHPSFSLLSTVDFNVMNGFETKSMLNFLKKNNYQIQSTVATKNTFFNSPKAYKSLGFTDVDYLRNREPFLNDQIMFESDVFNEANDKRKNSNSLVFSYTLGMYGHTPHFRDLKKRPNLIRYKDITFEKIINQFIYRTRAIYKQIQYLKELEHNAIILILGDHLPPQVFPNIKYQKGIYENLGLLLVDGKKIDISSLKAYEIHWKLIEILTQKKYNIPKNIKDFLPSYFNYIYQSRN